MFPLTFPLRVLSQVKINTKVYDPFCGRGTTNYAARLLGISSYGVDSNPVAHAIAQSKLIHLMPKEVVSLCKDLLTNCKPGNTPKGEFWQWAYNTKTLNDICKIRSHLNSKNKLTKPEIVLRAIMLGILHGPLMKEKLSYLSNQMPRTFSTKPDYSVKYWKERLMAPPKVDILTLVREKTKYIFNSELPKKGKGQIILGDSRIIKDVFDEKFDLVITSPPYYGMSTYEQDQWLRNWFLGGSEKVDYTTKKQLNHWSESAFTKDLSLVWNNTAQKCNSGAKLVIRFGALPSKSEKTPAELLKESLKDSKWKLQTILKAGQPIDSKRQANQFKNKTGNYIEEIDVFAILNN